MSKALDGLTRIIRPHGTAGPECFEGHEWVDVDRTEHLDRLGRVPRGSRLGSYKWLYWGCTNPDCEALALVSKTALEEMAKGWLTAKAPLS